MTDNDNECNTTNPESDNECNTTNSESLMCSGNTTNSESLMCSGNDRISCENGPNEEQHGTYVINDTYNQNNIMEQLTVDEEFSQIYVCLLESDDEDKFIYDIGAMINKYTIDEINKIKDLRKHIFDLLGFGYDKAHKLSLLMYIRSELFSKINLMIVKYIKLKKQINLNEHILEIIVKVAKFFNDCDIFLSAFKLIPIVPAMPKEALESDPTDNKKNTSANAWFHETKNEMIKRLNQLVDYFTLSGVLQMGVKKVRICDIYDMNHKKLTKYYNKMIIKIKKYIDHNLDLCKKYVEMEKEYINALSRTVSSPTEDFELIATFAEYMLSTDMTINDVNDDD